MTTASDQRLIADSTELVLDRLEAWLAGDQQRVAQIDAAAPKDTRALAAMWSAALESRNDLSTSCEPVIPRMFTTSCKAFGSKLRSTDVCSGGG